MEHISEAIDDWWGTFLKEKMELALQSEDYEGAATIQKYIEEHGKKISNNSKD